MKHVLWAIFLILIAACCSVVILSPWLGFGENYDFFLYRAVGVSRSTALALLISPALILGLYQVLGVGVVAQTGRSRTFAVLQSAWADGGLIARQLTSPDAIQSTRRDWLSVTAWIVAFVFVFAVFFWKNLAWYKLSWDQHWWQAMLDYGIEWGTPAFSFGGNVLYNFGIQLPLKGQLLPLEGAAHWFPIQIRIPVAVTFYFLLMGLLFWVIGTLIGLRRVHRAIFAGSVALLTAIPEGLNYLVPILPPHFFTHQFILAYWWGEAPLLLLATALLFFMIGRPRGLPANIGACVGFAVGAFAAILAYPVGAVYFVPLLSIYCLAFFLTCESRREQLWKAAASASLAAIMLIARVPQFLINLYSYSFAGYFIEFHGDAPSYRGNFLFASHDNDVRGLLVFMISFAALLIAARKASGPIRRLAIAALLCEATIIAVTTINLWAWRIPLAGAYAELAHAPLWGAFLVLSLIVFAQLVERRVAACGLWKSFIEHRRWAYGLCMALLLASYAVLQAPKTDYSDYPPGRPPSIDLLAKEIGLTTGSPFRGRLMTLVPANLQTPSNQLLFNEIVGLHYRRYLGNDHFIDVLPFNIPTVNEFAYWTSPLTFAFFRVFLGKEGEFFGRAWFVLSQFDLRIARLIGVRMVVTDALEIPGGTLVYETKAGDSDLRVFRIGQTNLGQYSPTHALRVQSASEAISAMKQSAFEPMHNVIVESELPAGLQPATSVAVSVESGPALRVQARSTGRSLLVLPIEYSHCLQVQSAAGQPQLIPVNLQQTGLLFDTSVDARVVYRFGLFSAADCRGDDKQRADNLGLKEMLLANHRANIVRTRPTLW